GPRGRRHHDRLARLGLPDVHQADVRRHAWHTEDTDGRRNRRALRVELPQIPPVRQGVLLPSVVTRDEIAWVKTRRARTDDPISAPEAADTTTVSPALGCPMSIRPTYAVMPGIPRTPMAVEIGGPCGSSFLRSLPFDRAYSCHPS